MIGGRKGQVVVHEPDKSKFSLLGDQVFHKGPVNCLEQINDLVVSAGSDKLILVWSIVHKQCIAKLRCPEEPASMMTCSNLYLMVQSKDANIFRYSLPQDNDNCSVTQMYSESQKLIITSDIFVETDDGLIFLDVDKLIKFTPEEDNSQNFSEIYFKPLEPLEDETN